MNKPRIVLDTNCLISGVLTNGYSRQILNLFIAGKIIILYSKEIALEYKIAISSAKIMKLTGLTRDELLHTVVHIEYFSESVNITSHFNACRDATDNKFLNCAVDGSANFIISKDKDLLILNPFQGIPILDDKQFLKRF